MLNNHLKQNTTKQSNITHYFKNNIICNKFKRIFSFYLFDFLQLKKGKKIIIMLMLILVSGCKSYDKKITMAREEINKNNIDKAIKILNNIEEDEPLLGSLEQARVYQINGDFEKSKKKYNDAINIIKERDDEAEIRLSKGVENVGSILVNDTTMRYELPGYEEGLVRTYQCLNYLMLNDLQGANVEMRNVIRTMRKIEKELDLEESTMVKDKEEIDKKKTEGGLNFDVNKILEKDTSLNNVKELAKTVNSSYENAFCYFLASQLEELEDNSNKDVSLKKATNILGESNNRICVQKIDSNTNNKEGKIIFIMDNNLIPLKEEVIIPFPTGAGISSLAFSTYKEKNSLNVDAFDVRVGENGNFKIPLITNVQAMAYKNYDDRFPAMITRMVLRVVTKVVAQHLITKSAEKHGGGNAKLIAMVGTSVYNLASERADTRSWGMLPAGIGMSVINYKLGETDIIINNEKIKINVKENGFTVVYVRNISNMIKFSVTYVENK